jgi:hypothetical protein
MSKETTTVEQDGLGDWRIQAASRLAHDLPAAYPGGPSHKAGAAVVLLTNSSTSGNPNLGFQTPSATALVLSTGFRAAEKAALLWSQIEYRSVPTPNGLGSAVKNVSVLFDYFEEALAAANSSFQAIEAFSNATIARLLKGTIAVPRREGNQEMDAEQIERWLSTSEKIAIILPALLKIRSTKGSREWHSFVRLKAVRDASIHFKSGDQYPGSGQATKGTLYYILLNSDPREFPMTALRVIEKLSHAPHARWLSHLIQKHCSN